jgi:hypothetical protein
MARTQAIYYHDRLGAQPVVDFIDTLPIKHRVAVPPRPKCFTDCDKYRRYAKAT